MTTESWHLKGEYFENCNCEVLCPCVVPGPPTDPTEGHCDVGFAFHIQEGNFAGVPLNDLNFVVIAYTPGNMGAGNWTTAVYIDEKPTERKGRHLAEYSRATWADRPNAGCPSPRTSREQNIAPLPTWPRGGPAACPFQR